jgi:hypothetical protein
MAGAPGSFEPVGPPRRGAPPLQVGRGCSTTGTAADSRLCYHPRSSQGTEYRRRSNGSLRQHA